LIRYLIPEALKMIRYRILKVLVMLGHLNWFRQITDFESGGDAWTSESIPPSSYCDGRYGNAFFKSQRYRNTLDKVSDENFTLLLNYHVGTLS
jgi:hypothetical protein